MLVAGFTSTPQRHEVARIREHVQNGRAFYKLNHKQDGIHVFCQGLQELGQYQETFGNGFAPVLCTLFWSQCLFKVSFFLPF